MNRLLTPLVAASVSAGLTALIQPSAAQTSAPPRIAGVWQAENGQMKIEIVEGSSGPTGRLLWGQRAVEADGKTFKRDVHNPDPALRGRSLEGITILQNLSWNARERRWDGGRLYDGTSGRTVSARLTPTDGKLEMRAYMGSPMLGRTIAFRRAAD
ncbi:hypothetical protein COC42_12025 [Sphingomonas spermidinifaciens]|uniref:DUF2147 domain-containing protein n=1 Tax=Sphingomonas spermidinifaciens TaxID=1141889 RepID=A0A2A4B3G6_9SPHN|nr:DUF2147 domain-containing protein [Sphingomonas spermidinifaciens]PCD02186.1 hypothetical protein COC42_12025 [Sphingomonas spermidinifaciens]